MFPTKEGCQRGKGAPAVWVTAPRQLAPFQRMGERLTLPYRMAIGSGSAALKC